MDPTPAPRGVRLSTLALVGIILLSVLLGCMLGALLGGAGGFLTARSMASSAQGGLQQQVDDLQRQLRDAQSRQPTAAPAAGRTPTAPASSAPGVATARPGQSGSPTARATAPAGGQAAPTSRATQAPGGGQTPPVYLGVRYIMLNPDIAAQLGITNTQGAAISEVVPDSPAQKAGLAAGDIITAMDGRELGDNFTLADGVVSKKPGDTVEFTVLRDDRVIKITATLATPPAGAFNTPTPGGGAPTRPGATATPGARPTGGAPATPTRGTAQPPASTPSPTRPPGTARPGAAGGGAAATSQPTTNTAPAQQRPYLGVQVAPVTDEVAKASGLKQAGGVVIERVVPSSPAYQAGLFDGDIILAVEGTPVDATHSLTSLLAARKPGDKVKLHVVRNGKEEDLTVALGAATADFNEGRPGGP
ncbi:MAG: PDZ domain-containing protein [Anaerolineae bacterium]|nr:PDZ domain-containing protein [Anaerolineae bacterium]